MTGDSRAAASSALRRDIYVLSDSTGNLARHMLTAFLTQFPPSALSAHFHPFVTTEVRLNQVLQQAKQDRAIVCHALVSQRFKDDICSFCATFDLPCHDLTGSTVEFLARHTGLKPQPNLDALHRLDESYNRRVAALEFTLNHDDGLGLSTLEEADIIIVGVSRTGKTPTSIYLAQQGYKIANVSLAQQVDPPRELLAMRPGKIVGFIINPQQLAMIRSHRQAAWNNQRTSYDDPSHVQSEIAWARKLFSQQGWPVLDVTDQAVEETAARILDVLKISPAPTGPLRESEMQV